eukprot:13883899-Heterocapsa_arctica.AAC.1
MAAGPAEHVLRRRHSAGPGSCQGARATVRQSALPSHRPPPRSTQTDGPQHEGRFPRAHPHREGCARDR